MSKRTLYEYFEPGGVLRFRVERIDEDDGKKRFVQSHRERAGDEWVYKAPPWPRPVFGADMLPMLEDGDPVLVVEGEKTALAARQIFGERLTVVTWAGGVNAPEKADWGPLKRFRVAVWPDIDRHTFPEGRADAGQIMPFMMQPGTKAALKIVSYTGGALVNIPDQFISDASWVAPDGGWDLADELPADWSYGDCEAWIRAAFEALKPQTLPPAVLGAEQAPPATEIQRSNGTHVPAVDDDSWWDNVNLITNARGDPKPILDNATQVLSASDRFKLALDDFSHRPCANIRGVIEYIKDEHILMITRWLQQQGVIVGSTTTAEAVLAAAAERRFHPVRDYLNGIKWDGEARIDMWLIDHADAPDTELVREMSGKWLIQAVARIMDPGCKADAMLVLEGPQGIRKSTLLRSLFGAPWFTDHLPDLNNKDAMLQLLGTWCVEVAEMATFNRAESAQIKKFLTSPSDRYRPPFGKVTEDFPRQCVFAGTVNPGAGGYLKDPTGGRRFWPVKCGGMINVEAVERARDQLWAEATHRYRAREPYWLDETMENEARTAQEERGEEDAWEARVAVCLETRTRITMPELLACVGLERPADWTLADQQRLGRIITKFEWERKRERHNGTLRWVYVNPSVLALGSRARAEAFEGDAQ